MTLTFPNQIVGDASKIALAAASIVSSGAIAVDDVCNSFDQNAYSFAGEMPPIASSNLSESLSYFTISIPEIKETWDRKDTQRFKSLAIKQALGQISPEEEQELEFLQTARRRLTTRLSGEQILADFKRTQMLEDLCAFFEKHSVHFNAPDPTWSRAAG